MNNNFSATPEKYAGLTADSRKALSGGIFVAVRGVSADGHNFIKSALNAGVAAVVCEKIPEYAGQYPEVEWVEVPDSAAALGALADEWYGHPSAKLTLIGVTGTNGKTTIATLLYEMAKAQGQKAGLISTVENKIDDMSIPTDHTTPDTITLHSLIARMVEAGCTFCAMEVSSHAAHQKRIAGLDFDGGIFTNLTRDHLDYHKTFANYLAAKKSFFDALPKKAFALSNADDKNGMVMLQNTDAHAATYSIRGMADFRAKVIEDALGAMELAFDGKENTPVHTAFTGRYNASNLAAVYGAWRLLGNDFDETLRLISTLTPVAGRMQTFRSPDGITAVVDYAHTPDALANTLQALREVVSPGKRIITVVGAGGDRDHGKRPMMGAEAAKNSDILIITSDNPRTEDPDEIALQVFAGVPEESRERTHMIPDRAQAINTAIDMANAGDAVLIAGKGHEDYQIIGKEKHHFDDREEVMKCFNKTCHRS